MPKMKTYKALTKRVKKTKKGKVVVRAKSQDHFNTHETGKKTRNKRRDGKLHKSAIKSIKKYL